MAWRPSEWVTGERIGERAFELTEEEWAEQAKNNSDEIGHFMFQVSDALSTQSLQDQEPT